jgi:hypothetical protein
VVSGPGGQFNYDAAISDTMDSHRLALLAEAQGLQKPVMHEVRPGPVPRSKNHIN